VNHLDKYSLVKLAQDIDVKGLKQRLRDWDTTKNPVGFTHEEVDAMAADDNKGRTTELKTPKALPKRMEYHLGFPTPPKEEPTPVYPNPFGKPLPYSYLPKKQLDYSSPPSDYANVPTMSTKSKKPEGFGSEFKMKAEELKLKYPKLYELIDKQRVRLGKNTTVGKIRGGWGLGYKRDF